MRFAIALSILSHSLPVSSKTADNANPVLPIDNGGQNKIRRRVLLDEETLHVPRLFENNVIWELQQDPTSDNKDANGQGTLTNLMTTKDECDPAATNTEADVGVLGCGVGRSCMASDASSLGGLCVDDNSMKTYRRLDDYAFFTVNNICQSHGGCDCNWVDLETQTGIAVCRSAPAPLCDSNYMWARDEHANLFLGLCFNVTASSKEKPFCFGYLFDNPQANCTIAVDGTPCSSCYFITDFDRRERCSGPIDTMALGVRYPFAFNCENVGFGTGNYSCADDVFEGTDYIFSCKEILAHDDDEDDDNNNNNNSNNINNASDVLVSKRARVF